MHQKHFVSWIRREWGGYYSRSSCADHIYILWIIVEQWWKSKFHLHFIDFDFEKVSSSVNRGGSNFREIYIRQGSVLSSMLSHLIIGVVLHIDLSERLQWTMISLLKHLDSADEMDLSRLAADLKREASPVWQKKTPNKPRLSLGWVIAFFLFALMGWISIYWCIPGVDGSTWKVATTVIRRY